MMTLKSPSEFGIAECPEAGEGCHRWLMSAVNALIRNEIEEDEIIDLVTEWMTRPPQPSEIENTIRRATQAFAVRGCRGKARRAEGRLSPGPAALRSGGRHGPPCQHLHQIGAVGRRAVQVGDQVDRRHHQPGNRAGRKTGRHRRN